MARMNLSSLLQEQWTLHIVIFLLLNLIIFYRYSSAWAWTKHISEQRMFILLKTDFFSSLQLQSITTSISTTIPSKKYDEKGDRNRISTLILFEISCSKSIENFHSFFHFDGQGAWDDIVGSWAKKSETESDDDDDDVFLMVKVQFRWSLV